MGSISISRWRRKRWGKSTNLRIIIIIRRIWNWWRGLVFRGWAIMRPRRGPIGRMLLKRNSRNRGGRKRGRSKGSIRRKWNYGNNKKQIFWERNKKYNRRKNHCKIVLMRRKRSRRRKYRHFWNYKRRR